MNPQPHAASLAEQLAAEIGRQILAGTIKPGDRLPSLRQYARVRGCGKNTVIAAYELLAERHLIEPHHGKGFFVRASAAPAPVAASARDDDEDPPGYGRAIDTIWLMRQQAVRRPGSSHLGEGFPPVDWLMDMRLDKFHRQIVRSGIGGLFRYGNRYGYPALRQLLIRRLAGYGIEAAPRQIVTTLGANHALDLIIRRYVTPGDPVLVEEPGYYPLFGKLRLQGARLVAIKRTEEGPDLEALERALRQERPRVLFLQSAGHNPTGTDIPPHRAHRILQLAEAHGVLVVENDALADFKPAATLRLAALDQLRNTLYVGSFSKSVSAALRVGFIAGDKGRIEELADLKMLLHIAGSEYGERILEVILREGNFLLHVTRLQERLRTATEEGRRILQTLGATVYGAPTQSLYLWARFPGIDDTRQLTARLLPQGVVLAPGAVFHTGHDVVSPWTRLNVAYLQDPGFLRAMREVLGQEA